VSVSHTLVFFGKQQELMLFRNNLRAKQVAEQCFYFLKIQMIASVVQKFEFLKKFYGVLHRLTLISTQLRMNQIGRLFLDDNRALQRFGDCTRRGHDLHKAVGTGHFQVAKIDRNAEFCV
jgi:hypothetical protein